MGKILTIALASLSITLSTKTGNKAQEDEIASEGSTNKLTVQVNQSWYQLRNLEGAGPPTRQPQQVPNLDSIFKELGVHSDVANTDMDRIHRKGAGLPPTTRPQASQFMKSPKLSAWLADPSSRKLLVQGRFSDEKISPLSFVISVLLQSLERLDGTISLHYFCALHTDVSSDFHPGARSTLQSLIIQLMCKSRHQLSLGFIDHDLWGKLNAVEVGALCGVFEGLLFQLPPSVTLSSLSMAYHTMRLESSFRIYLM